MRMAWRVIARLAQGVWLGGVVLIAYRIWQIDPRVMHYQPIELARVFADVFVPTISLYTVFFLLGVVGLLSRETPGRLTAGPLGVTVRSIGGTRDKHLLRWGAFLVIHSMVFALFLVLVVIISVHINHWCDHGPVEVQKASLLEIRNPVRRGVPLIHVSYNRNGALHDEWISFPRGEVQSTVFPTTVFLEIMPGHLGYRWLNSATFSFQNSKPCPPQPKAAAVCSVVAPNSPIRTTSQLWRAVTEMAQALFW